MTSGPPDVATRDETLAYLRTTIARHLAVDVAEIPLTARLFELPNIDSLKALQIILEVEEQLGITLDSNPMLVLRTVTEVTDVVVAASRSMDRDG